MYENVTNLGVCPKTSTEDWMMWMKENPLRDTLDFNFLNENTEEQLIRGLITKIKNIALLIQTGTHYGLQIFTVHLS